MTRLGYCTVYNKMRVIVSNIITDSVHIDIESRGHLFQEAGRLLAENRIRRLALHYLDTAEPIRPCRHHRTREYGTALHDGIRTG